MNITRHLKEINEVSDLENIVKLLEGNFNLAFQKNRMLHDYESLLDLIDIQKEALEAIHWINERLESGYWSGDIRVYLLELKGRLEILTDLNAYNNKIVKEEKKMELEVKGYDLLEGLGNEEDVLEQFVNEYDTGYICDVIAELADSSVPIYTNDLWENAKNIREYIEEAIDEGLIGDRANLEQMFQSGYYVYYQALLYNNLDTMVYNRVVNEVNEYIAKHDMEGLDIEALEEAIEDRTSSYDNNDDMESIKGIALDIIEKIEEGSYKEEE